MSQAEAPPPPQEKTLCPLCRKPDNLCVCAEVSSLETKTELLILQHPQEQDFLLGTARLACRALSHATLKIGLSWPNLGKILGREADPGQWAVLHLGALRAADLPNDREVIALDRKGVALPDQEKALAGIRGVILFDGSWSQAKTLWWRNAWTLKCRRLALNPRKKSAYGALRREPRREALSTIEAAGLVLARIERRPDVETHLQRAFALMLDKYREAARAGQIAPPPPKRPRHKASSPPRP